MLPETQVEQGNHRNASRRTRMRFARAGGGFVVACGWLSSTEPRMCMAIGKGIPSRSPGSAAERRNGTAFLHRSCEFVFGWFVFALPCSFHPGLRVRCHDECSSSSNCSTTSSTRNTYYSQGKRDKSTDRRSVLRCSFFGRSAHCTGDGLPGGTPCRRVRISAEC